MLASSVRGGIQPRGVLSTPKPPNIRGVECCTLECAAIGQAVRGLRFFPYFDGPTNELEG